jgi:hypothetical protein
MVGKQHEARVEPKGSLLPGDTLTVNLTNSAVDRELAPLPIAQAVRVLAMNTLQL